MADRVLRGSRLGAVSYETDRDHDLAPRHMAKYQPPNGEVFEVPFADDAELPGTWMCKNGQEGQLIDGPNAWDGYLVALACEAGVTALEQAGPVEVTSPERPAFYA